MELEHNQYLILRLDFSNSKNHLKTENILFTFRRFFSTLMGYQDKGMKKSFITGVTPLPLNNFTSAIDIYNFQR